MSEAMQPYVFNEKDFKPYVKKTETMIMSDRIVEKGDEKGYLAYNPSNPSDQWIIPVEVFEKTYKEAK